MHKKAMIVDDGELVSAMVEATLDRPGVTETLVVGDGEEALKTAQDELPDVAFLDMLMPGRSGYEVCKALKQDPRTAGIKVVMLHGPAQEFDFGKALGDSGPDDYVVRPFTSTAMLEKLGDSVPVARP